MNKAKRYIFNPELRKEIEKMNYHNQEKREKENKEWKCSCCGECCGCIPIDEDIIKVYESKAQRKVVSVYRIGGNIVPITEDTKCVFLDKTNKCVIYQDRPDVCRLFGKVDYLLCPNFDTKGNKRTRFDKKITNIRISNYIDGELKRHGQRPIH